VNNWGSLNWQASKGKLLARGWQPLLLLFFLPMEHVVQFRSS